MEMNDIEKGIVEMINQHNVKWLVMGAASDEYYNEYEYIFDLLLIFFLPSALFKYICLRFCQ